MKKFDKMWNTEDWWSVWLGLGIVAIALAAFFAGGTIRGWAVTPREWSDVSDIVSDF